MQNRLKEKYMNEVQKKLLEELGLKNKLAVPQVSKIVISIGIGEAKDNAGILDKTKAYLQALAGQAPVVTYADKSFDSHGNLNIGLREQTIFPEVDYKTVDKTRGMAVTITTTAKNADDGKKLLKYLGMPFRS